jgi:hypothetical protein
VSQRVSGYERKERDLYETPEWVTHELVPHIPERVRTIWEPAMGSGKMVSALMKHPFPMVYGTDISLGEDFLKHHASSYHAIITNPPYELATEFVTHAIGLAGFVAMLLRTDFDHAKTRGYLFGGCPRFAKKLVLTKRIKWFEESKGQPSFNHAWFIWDWKHSGPPVLAYGPV